MVRGNIRTGGSGLKTEKGPGRKKNRTASLAPAHINPHTHTFDISPSIAAETIHPYDCCAFWIMDPIWSKSLRRFGCVMGVMGFLPWEQRRESTAVIKESQDGVICILHSQLNWKWLAPAPVWTITIHIRYAFNFLYSNYGKPDLHGFV